MMIFKFLLLIRSHTVAATKSIFTVCICAGDEEGSWESVAFALKTGSVSILSLCQCVRLLHFN